MKKNLLASFAVLSLLASPLSVLAWTEPINFPPNGNVGAPIHIGAQAQTKAGALTILGDTNAATKGLMLGSNALILQNATQNLIYGNVDTASQGNLLNLQVENSSKFIVDKDGKVRLFANSTAPNLAPNLDIRGGNGIVSIQRDASDVGRIYLKRPVSAANAGLGYLQFFGYDSNNNDTLMSYIRGYTVSPTDGNEIGGISFRTINNGAVIEPLAIKGNAIGIGTADPLASLDMGATGGIRLGGVTRTTWPASGVGGGGTDNYLARWNGIGALETSSIYQRDGGNIGIGSTNPVNSKLEVISGAPAASVTYSIAGGAAVNAIIYPGGTGPAIQGVAADNSVSGIGIFGSSSKANGKAIYGYSNSATAYAGYFDGVSGRNYFANTVGIGNLNPNPAYKLDVSGDVNITGSYRVNGAPIVTGGGTEWSTSGNNIYNANTGNVGIGTGAVVPTEKLDVRGNIFLQGNDGFNLAGETATLTLGDSKHFIKARYWGGPQPGGIEIGSANTTGDPIRFTFEGNEIARIDNNGRMGIGTVNPTAKLNIAGTTGAAIKISSGGDITITPQISGNDSTLYNDTGTLSITTGVNAAGNLYATGNVLADGVLAAAYSSGSGDAVIVGNDSKLVDINIANTMGIYGNQDNTTASIKLGSNGGTLTGGDNGYGPGVSTNIFEVSQLINPYEGAGPGGSSDIRIPSGKVATPVFQGNMSWFKGGNFGGGAPAIWWCNQYNRGRMGFYQSDAGVGDRLCYCRRDASGEYLWHCW